MSKDFRHITIAAVFALMLLLAGVLIGRLTKSQTVTNCNPLPPVPDTTWFTITETVAVPSPPDTVTNTVTKYVPVPQYIHGTDTITDTITVPLPFEQHFAKIDDVADVWFSGYQTKIDSAVAYRHVTTEIIKQPYEVARMPRLTLDVGAAAFYSDKSINPCLVGEMRYNAAKTTWSAYVAINQEGKGGAGVGVTYRLNLIK